MICGYAIDKFKLQMNLRQINMNVNFNFVANNCINMTSIGNDNVKAPTNMNLRLPMRMQIPICRYRMAKLLTFILI